MAISIGNIVIPMKQEAEIFDIPSTPQIIKQGSQPSYKPKKTPFKETIPAEEDMKPPYEGNNDAEYSQNTDFTTAPWYAPLSLLFGGAGALGFLGMMGTSGQVESTEQKGSGLTQEQVVDLITQQQNNLLPQPQPTGGSDDSNGLFGNIAGIVDLTVKVAPLFLLLALVSGFKKLF